MKYTPIRNLSGTSKRRVQIRVPKFEPDFTWHPPEDYNISEHEQTFDYVVELDMAELQAMIRMAAKNKNGISYKGPLKVTTKNRVLTPPAPAGGKEARI